MTARLLALAACGFYVSAAWFLVMLERRLPRRQVLWRTISSHALGAGRRRFEIYGLLMIAGVLCEAGAMRVHGGLGWEVPIWLCVLAAMLGGLLLFPTDSAGVEPGSHPRRERRREGVIHLHFAMGCFASATVIALIGQPKMGLLASGVVLLVMDWLALAMGLLLTALVVTGFWRPAQGLFGLAERGFFSVAALWFILTALALAFGQGAPPALS